MRARIGVPVETILRRAGWRKRERREDELICESRETRRRRRLRTSDLRSDHRDKQQPRSDHGLTDREIDGWTDREIDGSQSLICLSLNPSICQSVYLSIIPRA